MHMGHEAPITADAVDCWSCAAAAPGGDACSARRYSVATSLASTGRARGSLCATMKAADVHNDKSQRATKNETKSSTQKAGTEILDCVECKTVTIEEERKQYLEQSLLELGQKCRKKAAARKHVAARKGDKDAVADLRVGQRAGRVVLRHCRNGGRSGADTARRCLLVLLLLLLLGVGAQLGGGGAQNGRHGRQREVRAHVEVFFDVAHDFGPQARVGRHGGRRRDRGGQCCLGLRLG